MMVSNVNILLKLNRPGFQFGRQPGNFVYATVISKIGIHIPNKSKQIHVGVEVSEPLASACATAAVLILQPFQATCTLLATLFIQNFFMLPL